MPPANLSMSLQREQLRLQDMLDWAVGVADNSMVEPEFDYPPSNLRNFATRVPFSSP